MVDVVPTRDWAELNEALFADTWNPPIKRFRSNFAYRGINRSSFEISNGLSRLGTPYKNMEKNLIKQFKKYAHNEVVERDTEWHWLNIAQHHGLPTRLIDWTYSPYVALHFATNSMSDLSEEGAVWKVNFADVHELLQDEHRQTLQVLGANIFSIDALADTIPDLDSLGAKHAASYDIAVFFEPPAIDDRIVNQFAYFSALSDPFLKMDDWLAQPHVAKRVAAKKITFPATLKWEIRDKLDQSNINERVLMTGLDGLCAWLKRHYTPI
jgi:hypothetical protein